MLNFYPLQVLGQFPRFNITNNGNDNPENDHIPYMASIRLEAIDKDNFGRGHICAGVFISRKTILTVATCFYQKYNRPDYSYKS